jgi:hypothetical protein
VKSLKIVIKVNSKTKQPKEKEQKKRKEVCQPT